MKQKLALQQAGANDSEAESESEDEDETWGGKKKTYYGDEEVDVDVRSFPTHSIQLVAACLQTARAPDALATTGAVRSTL